MNRFYVTTPIYYVNDRPHIGHVYTTAIADVVARYHRLMGDDTFFLTGTDEHASKVAEAAAKRGITPQQCADENAREFEVAFERYGFTNDDFIRTTEDRHKRCVGEYVQKLLDSGDVYKGAYEGWYDAGQEEYIPENKAKEQGYKGVISGKPLVKRSEPCYFFRLSAYADRLLALLEEGAYVVKPLARNNEVVARIRDGLEDVPISRAAGLDWGINIPGDPEHVVYVWIDALINYLSALDTEERRGYWPADVHFMAKDILWFHAVIWPAMLTSLSEQAGYEWAALPKVIYAHSFWTRDGRKMGKSLGNFVDLEALDGYVDEFGLDALRYYLATRGPLSATDSDFSREHFTEVYNSDLANTVGNSLNRICNMTARYFDGTLPESGPAVEADPKYDTAFRDAVAAYHAAMVDLDLAGAAAAGVGLVRAIDGYIDETKPFKRAKDPALLPEVGTILYNCAEAMRVASLLLWPFLPGKMEEAWRRLGQAGYVDAVADRGAGKLTEWTTWGLLGPGTVISQGEPLFPRYQPPK